MAYESVAITEFLKDFLIVQEGQGVILECKLNTVIGNEETDILCQWYKNSNLIISCDNTIIGRNGPWHSLLLKRVTKQDEGVYCFTVKTRAFQVYTKCLLHIKSDAYDNATYYFSNSIEENIGTRVNLRCCNVVEGESFQLTAAFNAHSQICMWFRNDQLIPYSRSRLTIQMDEFSNSQLYINKAETADSGIYTVVSKTYGNNYECSYADFLVTTDPGSTLYHNETVPHIWQALNDITEVYNKDDVRLIFKASYDKNTTIEWTKDGNEVNLDDRVTLQTYNNQYIGLKLLDVSSTDSGTYVLVLRDKKTAILTTSSTVLNVKRYTFARPKICEDVVQHFNNWIVAIGNGITLRCSFNLSKLKYIYVVWIIGHKSVQRSDAFYKVICGADEFLLHIPVALPEMAGEVICQLRQHVAPKQSILLTKTKSFLAVLPKQVIDGEIQANSLSKTDNVYSYAGNIHIVPDHSSTSRITSPNEIFLRFQFSRLNRHAFFFDFTNEEEDAKNIEEIQVYKNIIDHSVVPPICYWRFHWVTSNKNNSYAIDLYLSNGTYSEIGITHTDTLKICEPPVDKLFKFRIRVLKPQKKKPNSTFCFVPEEETLRDSITSKHILPIKDFKKSFVTRRRIGQGTFGVLNVVRRRDGELFIAKMMKFDKVLLFNRAIREFNIMKNLDHPNTVALNDGYSNKQSKELIITMEYLWGGELSDHSINGEDLGEAEIIVYIRQILLALNYLHSKKIAHLDLKPDNIVFQNRNSSIIKLIDFGTARNIKRAKTLPRIYGSRDFMPPEIIHKKVISTYCDMWSLGAITYWLLTEQLPFKGSNWTERSRNISKVIYNYDDSKFRQISDRAKTFVSYLLRRQPQERMTAKIAYNHEWITYGPNNGRPKKIQVHARGGPLFIEESKPSQLRFKHVALVLLAVVRFRATAVRGKHVNKRVKGSKSQVQRI